MLRRFFADENFGDGLRLIGGESADPANDGLRLIGGESAGFVDDFAG